MWQQHRSIILATETRSPGKTPSASLVCSALGACPGILPHPSDLSSAVCHPGGSWSAVLRITRPRSDPKNGAPNGGLRQIRGPRRQLTHTRLLAGPSQIYRGSRYVTCIPAMTAMPSHQYATTGSFTTWAVAERGPPVPTADPCVVCAGRSLCGSIGQPCKGISPSPIKVSVVLCPQPGE